MKQSDKKALTGLILFFFASAICAGFFVWEMFKSPKAALSQSRVVSDDIQNLGPVNPKIKIPILMYHHIGEYPENADATRKGLTVSTQNFTEQVAWLKQQGFESVNLKDLYNYSQGKFSMPEKPIIFTFDDGYLDAFENAIPVLQAHNFKGSFAVITQWQGQTMGDNIYATWDKIKTAEQNGTEIVCHTQNHFDGSNSKFNSNYIYNNLVGCKADLEKQGIDTNILIYPYGHFTQEYITQAQKAGFVLGLTVNYGDVIDLNKPMELTRVRVNGGVSLEKFQKLILFGLY